jgi:Family of unknown function (DUF6252)
MNIIRLAMLLLGFLLINEASCRRDKYEETLPPVSQTGNNTFGCLVNGMVWRNKGPAPFPSSNLYFSKSLITQIVAIRSDHDSIYQVISIGIKMPITIGRYALNSLNYQAKFTNAVTNCYYQTDSISATGTLEITKYDTINNVISGLFNFKATKITSNNIASKGNCDSTINITEGRFDIHTFY